jgi:hypothetical protein
MQCDQLNEILLLTVEKKHCLMQNFFASSFLLGDLFNLQRYSDHFHIIPLTVVKVLIPRITVFLHVCLHSPETQWIASIQATYFYTAIK